MRLDKLDGLGSQPLGQMLARGSVLQLRVFVGRKIAPRGTAPVMASPVDLKSLVLGQEAFPAQVPFSREKRPVAPLVQRLGERHFLERKLLLIGRGPERLVFSPMPVHRIRLGRAKPVCCRHPRRIFSRQNARPGRAADRAGSVRTGEAHPLRREPIAVRCLVEGAAKRPQIAPPQIVGQDKYEIGPALRLIRHPKSTPCQHQSCHSAGGPDQKLPACHPLYPPDYGHTILHWARQIIENVRHEPIRGRFSAVSLQNQMPSPKPATM